MASQGQAWAGAFLPAAPPLAPLTPGLGLPAPLLRPPRLFLRLLCLLLDPLALTLAPQTSQNFSPSALGLADSGGWWCGSNDGVILAEVPPPLL